MRSIPNFQMAAVLAALAALASVAVTSAGAEDRQVSVQTVENAETAIFAGGCFWCVESDFDKVDGVVETISGYTGGTSLDPTYRNHTAGGHREAVKITFDPDVVSYEELVEYYFHHIDPIDMGGQFCDRGSSYLGAIFPVDDAQRALAEASRAALVDDPEAPKPIVTPILDGAPFYLAEHFHQDYYRKNPIRYRYYKGACGRSDRLEAVWGDYLPGSVLADGASG